MGQAPMMTNLLIEEMSGVDHPAHFIEGWIVKKSSDPADVAAVIKGLTELADTEETPVPDAITEPVVEGAPTIESLTAALQKADETILGLQADLAARPTAPVETAPLDDDALLKAADPAVAALVQKARADLAAEQARADAAEAVNKAAVEKAAIDAQIEVVTGWKDLGLDAETVGKALRSVEIVSPELHKAVTDALTAANTQVETSSLFKELGQVSAPQHGDAYERASVMAKARMSDSVDFVTAFAAVMTENPDLYADYTSQKG